MKRLLTWMVFVAGSISLLAAEATIAVKGRVVDSVTGKLLPARVYIRSAEGAWYFPKSAIPTGSAIEFKRKVGANSVEMFTTLSADPFTVELPPGRYTFSAEHGKEFLRTDQEVTVGATSTNVEIQLKRWINMAERGWYSGDVHSHLLLSQMTNILLAEDVNLGFPLSHWLSTSDTSPKTGNKIASQVPAGAPLTLDKTHLLYPLNTEYEIFTTGGKPHTLGAVLVLGHKTPLEAGVPPAGPMVAQARREGALLDLEKHSWPWSVAMVPVMQVDLFELANNHVWQTEFGFPQWTVSAAGRYMNLEMDAKGFTEWGWINFGFQTYYALLNCGFHLQPSAGTGAGVHPVPFGFGRVYVQQPDGFSYEQWMRGLKAGRSFVTTGPMLFVEVNGKAPGSALKMEGKRSAAKVKGSVESSAPIEQIEFIVNGQVLKTVNPPSQAMKNGAFRTSFNESLPIKQSSWVAVRASEKNGGRRNHFAHSSPVYFEVPGTKLLPRREEIDYLIQRVQEEITRNQPVLSPTALEEYQQALKIYQAIGSEVH